MSLLLRNIAATFVGTTWVGVLNLLIAPFVIARLGADAYGLVGIMFMLQGVAMPVGSGLGTVVNREIARMHAGGERQRERQLLHTIELIYWAIATGAALLLILAAPLLARSWVRANLLEATVVHALAYIAIAVSVQLPI